MKLTRKNVKSLMKGTKWHMTNIDGQCAYGIARFFKDPVFCNITKSGITILDATLEEIDWFDLESSSLSEGNTFLQREYGYYDVSYN